MLAGTFVPVFVAAATTDTAINPILDGIVRYFPAPTEEKLAHAHDTDGHEADLAVSDTEPLVAYVWKTTADPFVGKLTYVRVFAGVLASDGRVWNHKKERRRAHRHGPRGARQGADWRPPASRRRHRHADQAQRHRHRRHPG